MAGKKADYNLESILPILEKEGRIFTKAGRLRANVSKMIFDARREELALAAQSVRSLKEAFFLIKEKGLIPKYVPYHAFYRYFSKYGFDGSGSPAPPIRKLAFGEDEMKGMIAALERRGGIRSKDGRIRPGLLGMVFEFYRGEVFRKLAVLKNIRGVFDSLEGRLPEWITFASFQDYYRRFPRKGSVLGSRKVYDPSPVPGLAADPAASQAPAPAAGAAPHPVATPGSGAGRPAPAARPASGAGPAECQRPAFVPRGGPILPPEGFSADTLVKLRDGRVVKAGAPGAPVRDLNEFRDGIPKWRLPADAEEKWERGNDGKEVPVIWEEEDYPYLERPGRLWIVTKYNPAYPKTYPFKGTDMSMLADYGRYPELRYMQPMLISDKGRLYDLFYQLPLLGNVEIKRDGTYIFFGYPGKFFHNAKSYREMLSAKFYSNRDINPNPAKIAGRRA